MQQTASQSELRRPITPRATFQHPSMRWDRTIRRLDPRATRTHRLMQGSSGFLELLLTITKEIESYTAALGAFCIQFHLASFLLASSLQ